MAWSRRGPHSRRPDRTAEPATTHPRGLAGLAGSGRVDRDFAWLRHAADKRMGLSRTFDTAGEIGRLASASGVWPVVPEPRLPCPCARLLPGRFPRRRPRLPERRFRVAT